MAIGDRIRKLTETKSDSALHAKRITGHGLGTKMEWLCVVYDNKFGWNRPAITIIDMTVHSPENNRPNVVISQAMAKKVIKHNFFPHSYSSPEQVAFARYIVENWNSIDSGDDIDVDELL